MTNLLPQEQQKVIAKEYKNRRTVVALIALACTVIVSAGFLVPSFALSNVKLREATNAAELARKRAESIGGDSTSTATLQGVRGKLASLAVGANTVQMTELFDRVTDQKSGDIKIGAMTLVRGVGDQEGVLTVDGLAKNRESLTALMKRLQADSTFTSVEVPVSSFAKDRDIPFSMRLTGTF
jgi:hypothetical protein